MAVTSTKTFSRGIVASLVTTATTETVLIIGKQGTRRGGGVSLIIKGTGAGAVKVWYVDPGGNMYTQDPLIDVAKTANKLLVINYGGALPEYIVTVTPSGTSSQTWDIEACGVN